MYKKLKNKKILIVGGAGFIGHNLGLKLNKIGAKVSIIDGFEVNNMISMIDNKNQVPFPKLSKSIIQERLDLINKTKIQLFAQDARDYHAVCKLVDKIKPHVVIHLAAVSHADRSNKTPFSTFDHSFRTLENVLDASKNKIEQIIFLSSSMVFGNFKTKSVDENSICEPIGIYGALKYAAEKIIIAYNQVFNLNYTIIRPSALYGERCVSRRVGQIFIENALNNKKIIINGDGKDKLDFTYIEDLTDGITKCILNKKSYNQVFNITFGNSRKISEMLKILKDHFPSIKIQFKKRDKLMPKRGTLSTQKAKKLLKYKSNWPLEKGYPKYIEWYKKIYKKLN